MGIDSTVLVAAFTLFGAVLVAASSLVGFVWIASVNARRARERIALEANRAMKAEAYHKFTGALVAAMKTAKSGHTSPTQQTSDAFVDFIRTAMIYGGPDVINAFQKWREKSNDRAEAVRLIDPMLLAMREDLGESNKGIAEGGLFGLLVIGGPAALKKWGLSK